MPLDFVSSEFGLTWVLAQGTPATLQGDAGSFDWLDVISRIVHILAAITLAGGTFYQCAVVAPPADTLQGTEADKLRDTMRGRWSKLVMVSTLFLIISGIYNYIVTINLSKQGIYQLQNYYHPLIGIKILLAFFIFFVASMLAGRSEAAVRFRQKASFWLTINSLAAVMLLCIAGVLKVAGKQ